MAIKVMRLVLLHSPLVGPGTWRLLTPVLREVGHDVIVPDLSRAMQDAGPHYPALFAAVRESLGDSPAMPTIFVVHSGAGALTPYVAADDFAIFVDALLPHPGLCWFDTAPDALRAQLIASVRNGRVPPWHRWWPKGMLESLLGSAYDGFTAELRDLPAGYFEEVAPDTPALAPDRCAYLQLSPSYDGEIGKAKADGCLTRRLPLHHLAMLTHHNEVGRVLDEIARTLANRGG